MAQADGPVAGVAVSGIGPCALVADASGEPLRPAILYGIDTRASAEIAELNCRYSEARILEWFGSPLTTQSVGPKLLWVRRHEPEVWRRTRRFFMAHSFLIHRLTGEYVLDHHSASTCAPLYDCGQGRWSEDRARDIASDLELPRLLWPAEVAGRVTPEAEELTGLRAGTPVAVGTLDAWMEGVSVGAREPGDLLLQYGTTMVLIAVQDRPVRAPLLSPSPGVFPRTYTLAAGTAAAGALTNWFQSVVGEASLQTLLQEASAVPAGSEGLVALPHFAGERAPLFDPQARGLILGLTLRHGRGHLYRALLESTAYGIRHILDAFREAGIEWHRVLATGAGADGGLWCQVVSDVTGETQTLFRHSIGASYGAAWLAGVAAKLVDPDSCWNKPAGRIEPNPRHAATYDRFYSMYRDLYPRLMTYMHDLADEAVQTA